MVAQAIAPEKMSGPPKGHARPCGFATPRASTVMLALDDAALARVCIAATAVPASQRGQWLRDVAERIDPPPRRMLRDLPKAKGGDIGGRKSKAGGIDRHLAARARKARHRARQRAGLRVFRLTASYELIVGGLIDAGKISERDALKHSNVERVLSAMLTEWGKHWSR